MMSGSRSDCPRSTTETFCGSGTSSPWSSETATPSTSSSVGSSSSLPTTEPSSSSSSWLSESSYSVSPPTISTYPIPSPPPETSSSSYSEPSYSVSTPTISSYSSSSASTEISSSSCSESSYSVSTSTISTYSSSSPPTRTRSHSWSSGSSSTVSTVTVVIVSLRPTTVVDWSTWVSPQNQMERVGCRDGAVWLTGYAAQPSTRTRLSQMSLPISKSECCGENGSGPGVASNMRILVAEASRPLLADTVFQDHGDRRFHVSWSSVCRDTLFSGEFLVMVATNANSKGERACRRNLPKLTLACRGTPFQPLWGNLLWDNLLYPLECSLGSQLSCRDLDIYLPLPSRIWC